jgi:anti-sigma factor RsiW
MNCGEVTELIQLYLDNELQARDTLDMQKHLESCSACTRLLQTLLEQDKLLREEARAQKVDSHVVREKILIAVRRPFEPERKRWSAPAFWSAHPAWQRVAAIVALTIAAGLLFSMAGLLPGVTDNIYAAVAADHADHCSVESGLGAISEVEELARLSRTYGKQEHTPDLSNFGYKNPVGRVCMVNGTLFLHLVYYTSDQRPLSVFLQPHSAGLISDALRVLRERGYSVSSVSKSGVDVLVVTSQDDERGAAIATTLASQL